MVNKNVPCAVLDSAWIIRLSAISRFNYDPLEWNDKTYDDYYKLLISETQA